MKLLNKLERKFGRFAIPGIIKYFIIAYAMGALLGLFAPGFYESWLMLDVGKVLQGQVWRLVTFILQPSFGGGLNMINILFFGIMLYLYYMFGTSLENAWGVFRFNLYFFSGILLSIIAAFIIYFTTGMPYMTGISYMYDAMFFAFAALNPNMQFLLFFMIPIKVKWLAILEGFIMLYNVFHYMQLGFTDSSQYFVFAVAILVAMANFIVFFLATRNYRRMSPREYKRRKQYKMQVKNAQAGARHKCTVCGRTNEDDETLEFRYCSKCDGSYEYCMEHLFTHQHIKKH